MIRRARVTVRTSYGKESISPYQRDAIMSLAAARLQLADRLRLLRAMRRSGLAAVEIRRLAHAAYAIAVQDGTCGAVRRWRGSHRVMELR